MRIGLLITSGTFEHPCIKNDNNECSLACSNYCTPSGYTAREASILGIRGKLRCAVLKGVSNGSK